MRRLYRLVPLVAFGVVTCTTEPASIDQQGTVSLNAAGPTTIAVTKTAQGRLTKTFPWTIAKAVSPAGAVLFRGDAVTATYEITVQRGDSVNVVSVAGSVCVTNGGTEPTEGLIIVDTLLAKKGSGEYQGVAGAAVTIVPAEPIAGGAQQCYPYEIPFTPEQDAVYRNKAVATITNFQDHLGVPYGGEATADFTVPTDLTGEANRSVHVEDTNGQNWTFDASGSVTYASVITCDETGDRSNVARIVETGQADTAVVSLTCHTLAVAKTAVTEYTRTYAWAVQKTADTTGLILPRGFPWQVGFEVVPSASHTDGGAAVSGEIAVQNPAPMDAKIVGVVDIASPDLSLAVDCGGVQFPFVLAAGGQLTCSYAGDLPDLAERVNTATVSLQNVAFDATGAASESGTTAFTGSATITFGDPTTLVDECADVADDHAGVLGTVCAAELPHTFRYDLSIGAYDVCGLYDEVNTATAVANDTKTAVGDTALVAVNVPCGPDCTLSQGYWKNHSELGPAPYDSTWAYLTNGAATPFEETGSSWLHLLREPPKGGNAYIILARQFMAAWLSGLHGAMVADVATDIRRAWDLLGMYDGDPYSVDAVTGDVRDEFLSLAERLDRFNNGEIGPGTCDEDESEDTGPVEIQ